MVCGSAALFSALLVVTALRGRTAEKGGPQAEDGVRRRPAGAPQAAG
ncbi:hypothetical protein ACWEWX_37695 [Streptomyces asiaticus]